MQGIKKLFEKEIPDIKPSKEFNKKLLFFRLDWRNRDDNRINFLSSNLIGVYPFRWNKEDTERFYSDLIRVDERYLRTKLHEIDGVEKNWIISSEISYNVILYIIHLYIESNLSKADKEEGIVNLGLIMFYKMFTSLDYGYFRDYRLSKDIASLVYEQSSNRFLIKQLGNWQNVFEKRCEDLIPPSGVHIVNKKLLNYTTTDSIYIINDLQGKLRSIMKQQWKVLDGILQGGDKRKIRATTYTTEESEEILRDITDKNKDYFTYINSIIFIKSDFIKNDLIIVLVDISPSINAGDLLKALEGLSEYVAIGEKDSDKIINTIMQASVNYLYVNKQYPPYGNEIINTIKTLKGFWGAGKVTDKTVRPTKETLKNIVAKSTGRATSYILTTLTLSVLIYVFIRAMLKDKYK